MSKNKSSGPGRPAYNEDRGMAFPKHTPFSKREYCLAQGMEFTAKGKYIKGTGQCTPLTLNKFMEKRGSPVIQIKGLYAEPLGKKGLGRKAYMYQLRDGFIPKKTVAIAKVSIPISETSDTPTTTVKWKYTRKIKTIKAKTPTTTVDVGTGLSKETQILEDIKNALATPSPALPPETPVATVPVIEIPAPTPTVEVPAEKSAEPVAA